jgi:Zn-dependent protease
MNVNNYLLSKILIIPAILLAFTFHEYAHAFMAVKLGDDTPKLQGRLTLNPFAHVDITGFIMILLVGFGWAKPVETNPKAFKNFYKDDLKVSIAGPMANLILGLIMTILLVMFIKFAGNLQNTNINLYIIVKEIIQNTALLNCIWFFLNLLPIPGFDGFHVLRDLFPKFIYKLSPNIYKYQMIMFVLLILPIIGGMSILDLIVGIPGITLFNLVANFLY